MAFTDIFLANKSQKQHDDSHEGCSTIDQQVRWKRKGHVEKGRYVLTKRINDGAAMLDSFFNRVSNTSLARVLSHPGPFFRPAVLFAKKQCWHIDPLFFSLADHSCRRGLFSYDHRNRSVFQGHDVHKKTMVSIPI
jgi:hypothetical protein